MIVEEWKILVNAVSELITERQKILGFYKKGEYRSVIKASDDCSMKFMTSKMTRGTSYTLFA